MRKHVAKITKQFISIMLVLTLVINLPLGHLPNAFAEEVVEQEVMVPIVPEEDVVDEGEIFDEPDEDYVSWEETADLLTGELNDRREQNIKHFLREDGSIEAVTYPYSVHYEKEGEWVDIDNTLVYDEESKTYKTDGNSFMTYFSSDIKSDELVSLKNGDDKLSWVIPEIADAEVIVENTGESSDMRLNNKLFSKVIYKDAINGIDVEYVIGPDGVQEYFVVENEEELESLEDITIVMKTDSLEASNNSNTVKFRDKTGKTKFSLGQPVMFDGKGENVKEIPFELKIIEQSDIVQEELVQSTLAPIITKEPLLETNESTLIETEIPEKADISLMDIIEPEATELIEGSEDFVDNIVEEETISKTEAYISEISNIIDEANSNDENYYTYTLNLVNELPEASEITFPLIIDPDISSNTAKENIDDSYISSGATTVNYGAQERLKIGRGATSGINRAFIKINTLPTITSGDMVVSASLVMPRYMDENTDQIDVGFDAQLNLHNVTSSWTETGITWDNDPTFDSTVASVDFSELFDVSTGIVSVNVFDITKIAKGWYQNTIPNYGVMVKNADEGEYAEYHEFGSGEMKYYPTHHPYLSVVYVNTAGLEDSYSYHEQSIGRAGTSYINDATGHMTLVHSDVTTNDSLLAANLFHTYNTSLYNVQSGYGKGFRISYDQTISAVTINNKNYYKYIDEDGTSHYFYQDDSNTNLYYDERNKNNKLTISGTTGTLVYEESHITKIFSSNKLKYIRDANGNQITITRDSSNRVQYITDPSGYKITLSYNSSGLLNYILAPDGKYTYFTYNTNGNLTTIKYPDEKTTTYTYNGSGYMSLAQNHDSYGMNFSYSGNPLKVTQVSESVGTDWYMHLMFKYGHLVTTVTDKYGKISHYRFNNIGQLVSEQDSQGNAVYYDYASSVPGKKDQLNVSSDIQNTAINLLENGNFVSSIDGWSISNTVTGATELVHVGTSYGTINGLKINKTNSSADSYVYATTTVGVGETYDFSTYVKYDDASEIYIYIEYRDAAGEKYVTKKPIINSPDKWTRNHISVEIPSNATGTIYTGILMPSGASGAVYIDDAQLTKGGGIAKNTLIVNGDFSKGTTGWTGYGFSTNDGINTVTDTGNYRPANLDNKVYKINGDINTVKYLTQRVYITGGLGDSFIAGAFVKADSIPYFQHAKSDETTKLNYGKVVLRVEFINDGTVTQMVEKQFTNDTHDWQYLSMVATADGTFSSVRVSVNYVRNQNVLYVDGVSLYKDGFGLDYTYDQDDNDLTKVETKDGEVYQYTYDNNHNLTSSIDKYGDETTYTYDSKHNLNITTYYDGKTTDYDYDSKGNLTSTKTSSSNGQKYYYTESEYNASKNLKEKDIDARGNEVSYTYTDSGLLETVTDNKTSLTYTYGKMGQVASIKDTDTTVNYLYSNDNIKSITVNGNSTQMNYIFSYNSFGQMTQTHISGKPIITNTYDLNKKYLTKSVYGNGYTRNFVYDDRDILVAETEGTREIYRNYYGTDGTLYKKRDNLTESTIHYDYDDKDRIARVFEDSDTGTDLSVIYSYNDRDQVTGEEIQYTGSPRTIANSYNSNNNLLLMSLSNIGNKVNYSYDILNRVSSKDFGNGISLLYSYTPGKESKSTTNLVNTFSINQDNVNLVNHYYTYDETGLIVNEIRTPNADYYTSKAMEYTYDSNSQLIKARNIAENRSMVYGYDARGNIIAKTYYIDEGNAQAPLWSKNYVYDSSRSDLLIEYDGKTITYDNIGNPTKYLDYTSLTWNGRQLEKIEKDSATVAEFEYNSDGIRTKKTSGGVVTEYIYVDGKLTFMKSGSSTLYFFYDAYGELVSVTYNNASYYYIKNPQGDVIGLTDASGEIIEYYEYDAWGYPESSPTTPIGNLNPFRYRGYIYDAETGFYYLGSRYYDPEVGRFINADDRIADVGENLIGYNMFAYCFNNPINMFDPTGSWPEWATVALGVGLATLAVAATVVTLGAAAPAAACTITSIALYYGATATVASAVATVTTTATVITVATYAGDAAYESVTGTSPIKETLFKNNDELFYLSRLYVGWGASTLISMAAINPGMCFAEGTLVASSEGKVPIEDIAIGDLVWAEETTTGEKGLKRVVNTFVNETNELVHVHVNEEEIISTPNHPFYSPVRGWVEAINLRAGDILVLQNGTYVVVELIQHEILEAPIKVYNFEVEDYHTYYVGESSVLVHNECDKKFNENQQTVIRIAKENKKGISMTDAQILVEWAKEYNIYGNPRIDTGHDRGNMISRFPHLHIGPVNHIPIFGD